MRLSAEFNPPYSRRDHIMPDTSGIAADNAVRNEGVAS
jgi:hypothetical protein